MGRNRDDIAGQAVVERRRRRPWLLVLVVLLLIIAVAVLAVILAHRNSSSDKAKKDVTVGACNAPAGGGKPKAVGQIVNHSSQTSNYVVRVKFKDAQGNVVSDGLDAVKSVKASATANFSLEGASSAKGPLTCEVSSVTRTHIPGQ